MNPKNFLQEQFALSLIIEFIGKGRVKMKLAVWSFLLALRCMLPFSNSVGKPLNNSFLF